MGLDFSHGEARFSYSNFHRFRKEVARISLGIDLDEMQGFGGLNKPDGHISWDKFKDHPLHDFLNHSDCDGELTVEQLKRIEPELRKISDLLVDDWFDSKERCVMLCDSMKEAINSNESLEFI